MREIGRETGFGNRNYGNTGRDESGRGTDTFGRRGKEAKKKHTTDGKAKV